MKKIILSLSVIVSMFLLAGCFNLSSTEYVEIKGELPEYCVVGEKVDLSGVTITVKKDNVTSTVNISSATVTGNTAVAGENQCTIKYGDTSATFTFYGAKKATALSDIAGAAQGELLFFPAGTYTTTGTIEVSKKVTVLGTTGTEFKMAGVAGKFDSTDTHPDTNVMFDLKAGAELVMKDVTLTGALGELENAANPNSSAKVELAFWSSRNTASKLSLYGCTIKDFTKGPVATNGDAVTVENCYMYYTASNSDRTTNAIQVSGNCVATIKNNTINGFYNAADESKGLVSTGVIIESNRTHTISGNTFVNCGVGVYLWPAGVANMSVNDVKILGGTGGGAKSIVIGTFNAALSSNKTLYYSAEPGIRANGYTITAFSELNNSNLVTSNTFVNTWYAPISILSRP